MHGHVYLIRNCLNGKVYVGQTTGTVSTRWVQHRSCARVIKDCKHLHSAVAKYGSAAFTIETLASCADLDTLNKLEHYFIKTVFQSTNRLIGYNIKGGGDSIGRCPEETRKKISETKRRRGLSPAGRAAIAASNRTRVLSPESREKIAATHRGRPVSEETRARKSAAFKGRKISEDARSKMSAAKKGKKLSPEHVANLTAAVIKRWALRKAQSAALLEKEQWAF